jgi:site-specific DNA recombinase
VETWILEALRHQLMAPDLVEEFVRTFNEESNRIRRDRDSQRASIARELRDIAHRIDALLEAVASRAIRASSVQAKLEALEARQSGLTQELAGLNDEPVRLHPNLAALYRRKVATLHDLLGSDATRAEAVEIIRSLIDQVTFRPKFR